MDIKTEKLLADLADYFVASKEEEEARAEYEDYSWDYHGAYLIEARQRAGEAFAASLNDLIDARIEARLGTSSPASGERGLLTE